MGYTHYWHKRSEADTLNHLYGAALEKAGVIVRAQRISPIAWESDEPNRAPETSDGIRFNGIEDEGHETFYLPANAQEFESFQFCKTAEKPYDVVVVAVLCAIDHWAPGVLNITSDGNREEWTEGAVLARLLLDDKTISIPQGIK